MFTTIQEGIQAIQKQVLSDTSPEYALYIPAQGKRTTYATEDAFDLHQAVSEFLKFMIPSPLLGEGGRRPDEGLQKDSKDQKTPIVDNGRKILLLLGDTGSGKSLFCQDLIARLWQNYKLGNPIPLFISLARLQDPIENAIEETLAAYGFSAEQIATLKKEQQFIFVLDGYDEIHQFKNLYVTNKLNEWNARTIITCRSQYLYYLSDADKHFMPFHGEKRQPQLLQQFYVAPFSEKEIVAYVRQYEKLNANAVTIASASSLDIKDQKSDAKSVEIPKPVLYQQLVSIPGLQTLITTPFLLHLAVEALPDILVKYRNPQSSAFPTPSSGAARHLLPEGEGSQLKLTQAALYDVFIERWFKRQESKLKTSKHIDEKAADPKPNFWKFCKELAVTMRAQNVMLINYTPEKVSKFASATAQAKLNPWKQFFNNDEETELLRSACPIRKLGPNQYGFIHASLIEYFATRAMYEEVILQQSSPQPAITIIANQDSRDDKLSIDAKDQKTQSSRQANLSPLPQSTLYQSPITKQNNMIQFLADRVQESEVFKNKLFEAIESSKKDERYAISAANGITALNCAEVNFNGLDFKGIKIPGANLSGALFDNTQLQKANLEDVNFQGAWLREANLSGANATNIHFGEWPWIRMESSVQACCYSPDGRWLAVANSKIITLFETETNRLIRTFETDTTGIFNSVNSIAFDAKSERLVSGSEDKTVRLWEVATGKELRCFKGHTADVNSVTFDSKGKWLASGSKDNTIRLWEAASGKQLHCLIDHASAINCVAFDAKSERLASGGRDKIIRLWEVVSGKEIHRFSGHTDYVNCVAFDSKGEWLASGSDDETVRLWEVVSGKEIRRFSGHTGPIYCVAFDFKSERLASGSSDMTVRVWEVANGKEVRCFRGHTEGVNSIAFDTKGKQIVTGSSDKTVRIWEAVSSKELRCLSGHRGHVYSVVWDAKGERLASGSWDKSVRLWKASTGKELRSLNGHTQAVSSVAFDFKGKQLATGGFDKTVRLWESASGKQLHCFTGHTFIIRSIVFDAKGERLASGSKDNTVRVWGISVGKELRLLKGHTDQVTSVAWDAKGERLASGSWDKTVRVWEVASGKELRCFEGHTRPVSSVAWNTKGDCLASGSEDHSVRLWDAITGKELRSLHGHTMFVTSVVWDAKGERLASGSMDKTVRVWEVANGKELYCLVLPQEVNSCSWTSLASGKELLAVAYEDSIACFALEQIKGSYRATLCWLATSGATLYTLGLNFTGMKGLNAANCELLQQRGAIGKPESLADEKNAASPSSAQLVIQHSPIFSASPKDNKQAIEIDNAAADKPKNDSSCAPCCSLM